MSIPERLYETVNELSKTSVGEELDLAERLKAKQAEDERMKRANAPSDGCTDSVLMNAIYKIPLVHNLNAFWETKLADLPPFPRARVEAEYEKFGIPWDELNPAQRKKYAEDHDITQFPRFIPSEYPLYFSMFNLVENLKGGVNKARQENKPDVALALGDVMEEIKRLLEKERKELALELKDANQKKETLSESERKSYQKMILGMAIDSYGHNPTNPPGSKRNTATGKGDSSIKAAVIRSTGLSIDEARVGKFLKEAAEELLSDDKLRELSKKTGK